MKTLDELKVHFETSIKPGLEELERQRIGIKRKIIIRHILFSLLALPFVLTPPWLLFTAKESNDYLFCIVSFLVGYSILPFVIFVWRHALKTVQSNDIRRDFKSAVISKIVKFVADELTYSPEGRMVNGHEFVDTRIFPHIPYGGYWIADDFVEGSLGSTSIQFYELEPTLDNRTVTGEVGGKKVKTTGCPYTGLFFIADFNKSFDGHTLVMPDMKIKFPGWWKSSGRTLMAMDDPEFEKWFNVYGTDPITARYILSTSLMKRIVDYRIKANQNIYLSFINGKLYLYISHKKNSFEMDPYRSVYDFKSIEEYYNDLRLGIEIVDELNLNTRIWLKSEQRPEEPGKTIIGGKQIKRRTYFWLAVILGLFGAHFFYAGYRGRGLLHLLTSPLIVLGLNSEASVYLILLLIFGWPILLLFEIGFVTADSKGNPMI